VYDGAVQDLIDELGRLPGIGPKSAQRMAFHLLAADPTDVTRLVQAIQAVKERVRFCEVCGNVAEGERCKVCLDPRRDQHAICVVEEPKDVVAIERTREFRGLYHVLGGAISPMDGIGPAELRFTELMARLGDSQITEVIVATDPNLEGEATASYLVRLLSGFEGITVSRLASGLPVGGDLEYADEVTLGRAFEGRRVMSRARATTQVDPGPGNGDSSGDPSDAGLADRSGTDPINTDPDNTDPINPDPNSTTARRHGVGSGVS